MGRGDSPAGRQKNLFAALRAGDSAVYNISNEIPYNLIICYYLLKLRSGLFGEVFLPPSGRVSHAHNWAECFRSNLNC